MASAGYQVVVARLMEKGVENLAIKADFNQQYGALMEIIRSAYSATMITDIKSLDLRTMFRPKVVLLVTDEITKHEHVQYRPRLAKFVETGGTLILCCWFVSKSTAWGIEGILWEFKQCKWTVAEGLEAFVRTDLALNKVPTMKQKFGDHAFNLIKDTYSMQAVSLKGVAVDDQVYRAARHVDFPGVEAFGNSADATPSAYHKYGRGYLGYVGDIKLEEGTKELIVAMLEASISPFDQSNQNQPTVPNRPRAKARGPLPHHGLATRPTPQKQGQENMGFKPMVTVGKGSSPTANTGARPSLQNVSPNGHPSSSPSLPPMSTSSKMLVMRNGSPIVTSMNAIVASSLATYSGGNVPQVSRSNGSNTDVVVRGSGHPMHSIHNLAARAAVPANIHAPKNADRSKATFSNEQPSRISRMTSQLETSANPVIVAAAVDTRPHESISQSCDNDSTKVNAKLYSSDAVADSRVSQDERQSPITLPSLKPVARNDITALHQFKKADSHFSTGEDSYGGGLTIPSGHTDLSGPPSCNLNSENAQLAKTWDAEVSDMGDSHGNEAPVYDDNCRTNGEINARMPDEHTHATDQASKSKHVSLTGGLPTHQKRYDDDDLYEASITASDSKTFKDKAEVHAHQAPEISSNTATDSKPTHQKTKEIEKPPPVVSARNSKPKPNKKTQLPILAPCNPGCAVCTILLPANKCTGCRRVQYCSVACQKADWGEHGAVCGPQPLVMKSRERVNGRMQELMDDSQSEDFEYGG